MTYTKIHQEAQSYLTQKMAGSEFNTGLFLGFYHENDVNTLAIKYLEQKGCEIFGTSLEKIQQIGPNFIKDCVHPKDLHHCIEQLNDFAAKKDEQETLTYVQRIKTIGSEKYLPYFTCVKLNLKKNIFSCVTLPFSDIDSFEQEVTNLLDEADYINQNIILYHSFSKREKEVISKVCEGFSAKEIGEQLFLSTFTIEKHKKNIYQKGNFKTKNNLIKFALNFNLL